jgi:hypothetical protein
MVSKVYRQTGVMASQCPEDLAVMPAMMAREAVSGVGGGGDVSAGVAATGGGVAAVDAGVAEARCGALDAVTAGAWAIACR